MRFTPAQLYYCYSHHFYVYDIADNKKRFAEFAKFNYMDSANSNGSCSVLF